MIVIGTGLVFVFAGLFVCFLKKYESRIREEEKIELDEMDEEENGPAGESYDMDPLVV